MAFVPLASAQEASPMLLSKACPRTSSRQSDRTRIFKPVNADKISALVEAKILPHFDFRRTTQVAMGVNWRRASADQQERLTREFKRLLVRTYSGALASYRDQIIEFKPLRASPGDSEVTVRSQVKQSGAEPNHHRLRNGKDRVGLEIFDVSMGGSAWRRITDRGSPRRCATTASTASSPCLPTRTAKPWPGQGEPP